MLPRPCLSFTLPSIHDNTKLDCRVFHPLCFRDPSRANAPWSGHAAVVAHPYAPLGGSFDDPIVDVIAGTLLQLGFLVATFNFRGAGTSEGRTSWTSKPEQADYISVVGFIAYYIHHLETRPSTTTTSTTGAVDGDHVPIMLLAGYSYGAMVTTRVPPLDTVLAYFATPAAHTAEADIRLRAQHLAEAQNTLFADPASPRSSLGIRVGGDEDGSPRGPDRQSISGFLREERIQESVRNLLAGAKLVYREYPSWSSRMEGLPDDSNNNYNRMDHCLEKVEGDVVFHSAYLVVSPPVGFVTRLATLALNPLSSSWMPWAETAASRRDSRQLTLNPTLVVYGDRDGFMGLRKMREWTRQLSEVEASRFRYVEVAGAGHFWAESDVIYQLRDAVGLFGTELTASTKSPV